VIQRMFRRVSDKSRRRKLDLFYRLFRPTEQQTILDLGGEASHNDQPNLQLLSSYQHRHRLTLVNLFFPDVKRAVEVLPGLKAVCGNGCRLPFADKQFDICYCNAVIEHLFSRENQQKFAAEIMRVAKSWFVTTPNRWFPFEPHMRLPWVTWLPRAWQHGIGKTFSYHHMRRKYVNGTDWSEIRLLSRYELAALFPGSNVIRNGAPGWTPTFIAIGGEVLKATDAKPGPTVIAVPAVPRSAAAQLATSIAAKATTTTTTTGGTTTLSR
jgi:predicted SAM-dependent methyltransferase